MSAFPPRAPALPWRWPPARWPAAAAPSTAPRSRVAGLVTPYKVDVVQGNFVSKEQVEALKPGMSRQQVRDILGTPLLTSVFHADRWDYVFTLKRQGVTAQARKLTVFFKGDVLERFEGDAMPTEAEFVATLDNKRRNAQGARAGSQRGGAQALCRRKPAGPARAEAALPPPRRQLPAAGTGALSSPGHG